jgi:hypothetical protein
MLLGLSRKNVPFPNPWSNLAKDRMNRVVRISQIGN